jgi:hypothetical protein
MSKALIEIQESQNKLHFENLQLGEIVQDSFNYDLCLVISKRTPWITLLVLCGQSYSFKELADFSFLTKLFPGDRPKGFTISELVAEFEQKLEWAHTYHTWRIDNLTYIEILARLREYEQQI